MLNMSQLACRQLCVKAVSTFVFVKGFILVQYCVQNCETDWFACLFYTRKQKDIAAK